jgi:NAD(P)-dependent dehydrogenase (short-subunit alcohol dehydrogenase family)
MTADINLNERVVIVTGASRGIGESIALACARAGAAVALAARKPEPLEATAAAIRAAGGRAVAIPCHTGHADEVATLFDRTVAEFGKVDGLVNNAATNPYFGPTLGVTDSSFDKIFEVNVKGCLYTSREFASRAKGGAIVNIASYAGIKASPLIGVYGMSKAAVISMTRTLAVELGPGGIRVNAIAPGLIDTRFSAALLESEEIRRRMLGDNPIPRPGRPEEIAGGVVYLLSDAAAYVTGHTLVIDGGGTA